MEEVDALAREIAGKDVSAEIQASARLVAEAQIDLRRVCEARQLLLMSLTTSKPFEAKIDLKRRFLSNILGVGMVRTSTTARLSSLTPVDEEMLAQILAEYVRRSQALDRYERNARWRRKLAIMLYDQICM